MKTDEFYGQLYGTCIQLYIFIFCLFYPQKFIQNLFILNFFCNMCNYINQSDIVLILSKLLNNKLRLWERQPYKIIPLQQVAYFLHYLILKNFSIILLICAAIYCAVCLCNLASIETFNRDDPVVTIQFIIPWYCLLLHPLLWRPRILILLIVVSTNQTVHPYLYSTVFMYFVVQIFDDSS